MNGRRSNRAAFAGALLAFVFATPASRVAADGASARHDARRLEEKIARVIVLGTERRAAPQRTPVSEAEVNAYLRLQGAGLPIGVANPSVRLFGGSRLQVRAIVDLDAIRRSRAAGSLLDPRRYVAGRVPVIATGVLNTSRGLARFRLERAELAGIPVPVAVMRTLVPYYSRTRQYPNGIPLDQPFPLAHRIKEIELGEGRAVIVQQ